MKKEKNMPSHGDNIRSSQDRSDKLRNSEPTRSAPGDTARARSLRLSGITPEQFQKASKQDASQILSRNASGKQEVVSPEPTRSFEPSIARVLGEQTSHLTTPSNRLSGKVTVDSVERDIDASEQKSDITHAWVKKGGNIRKRRAHFGGGEVTTIKDVRDQTSVPQSSERTRPSASQPPERPQFSASQPPEGTETVNPGLRYIMEQETFKSELRSAGYKGDARAKYFLTAQREKSTRINDQMKEIRQRAHNARKET
jgi:hypothetical protein